MSDAAALSQFVKVRQQFLRSIHVERDFRSNNAPSFYMTECAAQALEACSLALREPSRRAMAMVGPYGSGKSAFCLLLAGLVSQKRRKKLKAPEEASGLLAQAYRDFSIRHPLVPVLVVGSRRPLGPALVSGLVQSLEQAGRDDVLLSLRQKSGIELDRLDLSARGIADLFLQASELIHMGKQGGGLLLVVDELGKFLEYAVLHPRQGDIFVLQELAEAAARSPRENPLLVLTVTHQSPEAYAQKLGSATQAEWAKIGERFQQVPFFPSDRERVDIIGRSLERNDRLKLPRDLDEISQECSVKSLAPAGLSASFPAIARASYPLHPITLLALPALFRRTGQSHRSVFNFLSGHEQNALGSFLEETVCDAMYPPLYYLDKLFDYASEMLISSWSNPAVMRFWAEASEAVDRAERLSTLGRRVLKCIAVLWLLKDLRLIPSQEVLELALRDGESPAIDVSEALAELEQRRLIIFSRARNTYRLWEGGDVDVEAEIHRATLGLGQDVVLQTAQKICPPPHLIARRYSYETGTLRSVTSHPCHASELGAALARTEGHLSLIFCLAQTSEEVAKACQVAQAWDKPNVLTVIVQETDALRHTAREIVAAVQVQVDTPALAGDRPARRELDARRQEATEAFQAEWERLFRPGETGADWFWRGKTVTLSNRRQFSGHLSLMADETYTATPILRNELLNRPSLSSAAAAGRRSLVEAMLTKNQRERLGLRGFPPEVSMYECMVRATGIHRQGMDGEWKLGAPPADNPFKLREAWDALAKIIFAEPPVTYSVPEVWRALQAPPFGLTEGVLPVLLCAFLQANADETTLYREGTFLPEPGIADWELLLRRPEMFSVAGCRVSGNRLLVVERLARGFKVRAALVPVARALLRNVRNLPDYAWKTRRLSQTLLAVREAFVRPRSPERLLFIDLPFALNVTVMAEEEVDTTEVEAFFQALNAALREWGEATPQMLASSRADLLARCGLRTDDAGWQSLREQCALLGSRTTHSILLPFVRRAAEPGTPETILDSVLALLADRSPRNWTDTDRDRFTIQAQIVGDLFQQAKREQYLYQMPSLAPQDAKASRDLVQKINTICIASKPRIMRAALIALLQELEATP